MALARFGRQAKRPYGLFVKMTAVALLGLCFIFVWSIFSSPSSSLTTQRESFDDIGEPTSSSKKKVSNSRTQSDEKQPLKKHHETAQAKKEDKKVEVESDSEVRGNDHESRKKNQKEMSSAKKGKGTGKPKSSDGRKKVNGQVVQESEDQDSNEEEVQEVVDGKEEEEEEEANDETEVNEVIEGDGNLVEQSDQEKDLEKVQDESNNESKTAGKKRKIKGPLFDPKMHYSWKLCSTRSKHNYIPCIDNEGVKGRMQLYRHTERSCPRTPPICLVPLPHEGYETSVPWPESKSMVGMGLCRALFFQLS